MQKVVGSSPIIRSLYAAIVVQAFESTTGTPRGDDRPPICATCGVTMVPAALSAHEEVETEWVCLECEELAEDE